MNKKSLLLLFSTLSACTMGPDYQRPEPYQKEHIEQALGIKDENCFINTKWYHSFEEPTLNKLIALGEINNPKIKMAIQKLKQARLALEIQGVTYYPTLDLDGSYTKSKQSKNSTSSEKEDFFQAGLDVSWEVDLWGKGRRETEEARADAERSLHTLKNVQIMIKAEIINNYISLRQVQEQERLLNENLKMQETVLILSRDKIKAGLISQTAFSEIQYTTETIKSELPNLKKAIETYKNNLTLLTGVLPTQLDTLLKKTQNNIVSNPYHLNLNALYLIPLSTIRNRPDVKEAEMELIAQNAKIGSAVASLYPSISFSGFFGFEADSLSKLTHTGSQMYTLLPELSLPLIHWGKFINQVKLEKEATKEATYNYENTVLTAITEIKTSMVEVTQQYYRYQSLQKGVVYLQDKVNLTLAQYDVGLISLNEALSTFQSLLTAQITLAQSNASVYQTVVSFYKTLGY